MANAKFKKIGQAYTVNGGDSNFTISDIHNWIEKEYDCYNPFSFVLYAHAAHSFPTLLS